MSDASPRDDDVALEREEGRMNSWIHRPGAGPDPVRDTNPADARVEVVKRPHALERTRLKPYG